MLEQCRNKTPKINRLPFLAQLWKYDAATGCLVNKKGVWNHINSNIPLIQTFLPEGRPGHITFRNDRAFGLTNDNVLAGTKLIIENKDPAATSQLWTMGVKDKDGFFVIRNQRSKKFLTATSANELTIEGNGNYLWQYMMKCEIPYGHHTVTSAGNK